VSHPVLILGNDVFAEEVADLVAESPGLELAAFVENLDRERCGRRLADRPVLWVDEIAALAGSHRAVCGIGTNRRREYVEQVARAGLVFATVQHPLAHVAPSARIGAGCILGVNSVIGARARVGDQVIVNRGASIGHHTTVGDYVTIAPGANVAGLVTVEPGCWIGIGATVIDRLTIGEGAVVAAGAVVVDDVPDHTQVAGVPAREVKTGVDGR
jgi:sugar O-acyltransferase (sialic acid O-acetyltransferase NeuD family)